VPEAAAVPTGLRQTLEEHLDGVGAREDDPVEAVE
jgi:hypothetical protein